MTTPEAIIEAIADLAGPDQDALAIKIECSRHLPANLMLPSCEGDCAAADELRSELRTSEDDHADTEAELDKRDRELSGAVARIKDLQGLLDANNIRHDDI